MSLLQTVKPNTAATSTEGIRMVLAGVEKIGKTTLSCDAPKTLLIPLETGYGGITVQKTDTPTSFEEVMTLLDEITVYVKANNFPFKTLVFDSATALERLIDNYVLRSDPTYAVGNKKALTMESALGGYGKAYTFANECFTSFLTKCDALAKHGKINIIFTCHVFAAKVVDPVNGEYDTWDLLLHSPKNQKTYGKREILTQWADVVGFLHEPIFIIEGDSTNRGVSSNKGRVLGMSRTPGYVAGNRYGLNGEISIPKDNGWNHFAQALYASCKVDVYNRESVAKPA